jgi:hypothetical protein
MKICKYVKINCIVLIKSDKIRFFVGKKLEQLGSSNKFVERFNSKFSGSGKHLTKDQAEQSLLFAVSAITTPDKIFPHLSHEIKDLCALYADIKHTKVFPDFLMEQILSINPVHLISGIKYLGLFGLFAKIYKICPHSPSASNSFRSSILGGFRYFNISKKEAIEWMLEHKPNLDVTALLFLGIRKL